MDVEFSNPLQIPLDVSAVSLVCKFSTENVTEDLGEQLLFRPVLNY